MIGRRSFLKLVVPAASVAVVSLARVDQAVQRGLAVNPAGVVATRWTDPRAASVLSAQAEGVQRAFASAVYRSPHQFNAVGTLWQGPIDGLWVRASADGSVWTEWLQVSTQEAQTGGTGAGDGTFGDLVTFSPSRFAQYRYTIPAGGRPIEVTLVLMDSTEGPAVANTQSSQGITEIPPVISRAGWGCNESLRFDSQGHEIWPPEYRVLQKAIVHHTATRNDYANASEAAAEVRAIYYYHAVVVDAGGWGDIGYNFLIDRFGNVYEGRYGGDGVVAGHARRYNYGSLGVACVGSYGPGTPYPAATPSTATKQALARLIAWKCSDIDPHGQTFFIDSYLPNVMGHRDCLPTSCPGDNLYAHLPALRGDIQWNQGGGVPQPNGQITRVAFNPTSVQPGSDLQVEITVQNTGTATMITQGPAPRYLYEEGRNFQTDGYGEVIGAWRVAVDYVGNVSGRDYPYRWGLPDALEPGQSVTVTGFIRLNTQQTRQYYANLVREVIAWVYPHDTGTGASTIVVQEDATATPTPTPTATSTPVPTATCIPLPPPYSGPTRTPNPTQTYKSRLPLIASSDPRYCN